MARTLQQLKESIEKMIEIQGKDAPVAAFIFTQDDVVTYDEETLEQQYYPLEVIENVLGVIEEYDYIDEQVYDLIGQELQEVKV